MHHVDISKCDGYCYLIVNASLSFCMKNSHKYLNLCFIVCCSVQSSSRTEMYIIAMSQARVFCLFLLMAVSPALGQCPIWFKETDNGSCECGDELGGQIKCDKSSQRVSIALNYCMTYNNTSQELLTGYCNYQYNKKNNYTTKSSRIYIMLPSDSKELTEICEVFHQQGLLCGQCRNEYGVAINTLQKECIKCSTLYATGMSVLLIILPITLYYVLVVTCRLNCVSGKLLGYIIFCQSFLVAVMLNNGFFFSIIESMSKPGRFALGHALALSGVWGYSRTLLFAVDPICFHRSMTSLQAVFIEFIYVLYPLLLILVTWLCTELHARNFRLVVYLWKPFHKCFAGIRRNWSVSDSIVHAYATFFFLSFWSLVYASVSLLFSTHVYNINGTLISTVVVLDPTIQNFSIEHLPYAITAIALLFFLGLCPTMFLCLYSTKFFTKCFPFKPRTQLTVNIFVETFHSCYKDGLNDTYDYRFMSSAPMFFILLTAVFGYCIALEFQWHIYFLASFSFALLSVSLAIAYIRPYKTLYMNFSVTFHTAIIACLTGIVVIWFEGHIMTDYSLAIAYTFLASLPHIFALVTLVHHMLGHTNFVRIKFFTMCNIISAAFRRQPGGGITESLPDRLEHSYAYRTFP